MFFRVKWTITSRTETEIREYLASQHDAWELWNYLTSRSEMEPEYHRKMVEERRTTALAASSYVPPVTTVRIYDLDGNELSPEKGLIGMFEPKKTRTTGSSK